MISHQSRRFKPWVAFSKTCERITRPLLDVWRWFARALRITASPPSSMMVFPAFSRQSKCVVLKIVFTRKGSHGLNDASNSAMSDDSVVVDRIFDCETAHQPDSFFLDCSTILVVIHCHNNRRQTSYAIVHGIDAQLLIFWLLLLVSQVLEALIDIYYRRDIC
jgi:hypothetical protein